jgi:alkyl hydroperoxide reductase subunit D
MSIETIKNAIPDYAKDIRLNLSSIVNEDILTTQQLWGCLVACAYTSGQDVVLNNVIAEASAHLSVDALNAAKSAASIMAMNNVYYKFVGMSANNAYKTMQAKLRMNVIANPGVEKGDFELWSLAVSAMNGCKFCVDAHEQQLAQHNIDATAVQTAVRIASVIAATSAVLTAENVLTDTTTQSYAKAA